jgi:hypothetical protein
MRSCDDGYPGCRQAEATGKWCTGKCKATADTLDTETRTRLALILRQYAQGILTDSRIYQEVCKMLLERGQAVAN